MEATPIRDTEGALVPAISPDGQEVVFYTVLGGPIRVVQIQGGISRTLVEEAFCCPAWSPDGEWVYYTNLSRGLSRVPTGEEGAAQIVTVVDTAAGEEIHLLPALLPGGSGAVYETRGSGRVNRRIHAVDVETSDRIVLRISTVSPLV